MSKENLLLIEESISPIIKRLVVDMKTLRVIDEKLVTELLELLAAYKINEETEENNAKEFYGKLFFLYCTLVNYAQYSDYKVEHMIQINRLRVGILDLFSDVL